jgi:membrane protease YdiL (CAAX protease family)
MRRIIPALRALVAFALVILVGELIFRHILVPAMGLTLTGTPDFSQWPGMLYLGLLLPLVMVVITLLLYRFLDGRRLSGFGFGMDRRARGVTFWGLGLMLFGFGLLIGVTSLTGVAQWKFASAISWRFVLSAIVAYLGTGVWEEFYFRGYMYRTLTDYGKPAAYIVSILIFSFIHFTEETIEVTRVVDLLLVSFMLTYVYDKTGSIWPGVILHGAWDLINSLFVGNLSRTSLLAVTGPVGMPDRYLSIALNAALIVLTLIICRRHPSRGGPRVIRHFV